MKSEAETRGDVFAASTSFAPMEAGSRTTAETCFVLIPGSIREEARLAACGLRAGETCCKTYAFECAEL
jgi:hypothetical protein